ncbi:helix-turn-helix domain-containing protein [Bacillus cytotoxicus]
MFFTTLSVYTRHILYIKYIISVYREGGRNQCWSKKAYKFRIYPNKEQEILIAKTIGCSRFVFNHFLEKWNNVYKETGKGLTYNSCSDKLT